MSLCVESSGSMFARCQEVVEMRRFYPVDTVEYAMASKVTNANGVLVDL